MKYLLDTNVLIAMFKGSQSVREKIMQIDPKNCYVSELTVGELLIGAYKGGDKRQWNQVETTKKKFNLLPVTYGIIDLYARNRAFLESQGKKIDQIDLLIGSTALYHKLTIVTHNLKHFERIPHLEFEDWEK